MSAFESGELVLSTHCGLSLHLIQWQQFNHYRPLLLITDDIRKGKSYADQEIIM
jgi:hypothetical protein